MRLKLTAVLREAQEGGYVVSAKEIPAAITQGETVEEALANLEDAVRLLIETAEMITDGRIANRWNRRH
ncbi:MAG TPA: type II toxin-antitoxin system HicB family antitoxin [Longimicrobium sp.]|nr:type II toxin-antitoxin system HicB family antitoxin [Longimicrobium sp.]